MERGRRRTIQDLMVRLADGDRAAFDPLFELLWPSVRAFAVKALGSAQDADDAAQTALLKVFESAATFDVERDAVAWIFGIVGWECRATRQRRRRRREEPSAPEDAAPAIAAAAEDLAIGRDLEAALRAVVGTLSAEDQETLTALAEGRRPPIPAATFRKRVERALRRLRLAWSETHGHD